MSNIRQNRKASTSTLYEIVFASRFAYYSVLILLLSFLIQPIAPAYASELTAEDTAGPAPVETASEPEPEPEPEPVVEEPEPEPEIVEEVDAEDVSDETTSDASVTEETLSDTESPESADSSLDENDVVEEVTEATSTEAVIVDSEETATTSPNFDEEVADDTVATSTLSTSTTTDDDSSGVSSGGGGSGGDDFSEVATTTDTASTTTTSTTTTQETNEPATATSSETDVGSDVETTVDNAESVADENEEVVVVITSIGKDESTTTASTTEVTSVTPVASVSYSDLNHYQFAKQECVEVGDGSYYCSASESDTDTVILEDDLYEMVDAQGDKEIYLRLDGEVKQLSDNNYDDAAPYYDSESETVVWHRLITGRYHIISYDLETEEETQLTTGSVNNMEPSRYGDYTVWQRWLDGNWEIILFNGEVETRLTENDYHDIAPNIRGGYVIWHAVSGEEREVNVYEIETGLISNISDSDGGTVANPRFVLVYDTTYENGDVITKGFDFDSKQVVPLAAVPGELPDEIPSPEPTEETKALVQTKPLTGKDDVEEDDGTDGVEGSTLTSDDDTASSTEAAIDVDLNEVDDEPLELTEYDLVVTPISASSTQANDSTSTSSSVE